MATDAIEICNLMISWIGADPISGFDDGTPESDFCKFNYDMSRRKILGEHDWSFAVKRDTLNPTSDIPVNGYKYSFLKPVDNLRIIGVYDPSHRSNPEAPTTDHKVEGGRIIANLAEVDVRYIYDNKVVTEFSDSFSFALAALMGVSASVPFNQDKANRSDMAKMYDEFLDNAYSTDGLQGSRERLNISRQEQSRRLGTRPI